MECDLRLKPGRDEVDEGGEEVGVSDDGEEGADDEDEDERDPSSSITTSAPTT